MFSNSSEVKLALFTITVRPQTKWYAILVITLLEGYDYTGKAA